MYINPGKLISDIRRTAAANPDYVYSPPASGGGSCVYFVNGKPSCLIGQGLALQGFTQTQLSVFECNAVAIGAALNKLGIAGAFSVAQGNWLRRVQHQQDDGDSWSAAVRHADRLALTD